MFTFGKDIWLNKLMLENFLDLWIFFLSEVFDKCFIFVYRN